MAKRPEDRWPTAGQFAEAVEAALDARASAVAATAAEPPTEAATGATAVIAAEAAATRAHPAAAAVTRPRLPSRSRQRAANDPPGHAPFVSTRTRSRRGPALAALLAGIVGIVVAAIASGAFNGGSPHKTALQTSNAARAPKVANTDHKPRPKKHPKPAVTTTASTTPTTTSSVTARPAAATTTAPAADTLESQGHQLMASGNYGAAIPALQKALSQATPGSLTYAYALFDLGRSLRLSGNPKAAIPVLYRRLQIPNQTETVRQELQLALRAVGAKVRKSGGGTPAPPSHGKKHGRGGHGR
jgi:tetratricopeptide (TPR) repeat protein